ncbi:MAG: hypothetical protein JWO82_930 [Akkermansiaceae bacterium]|nr:hypothetical protein [Akkermansiaceae bacterium]
MSGALKILLGVSAVGVLGAASLAGAFMLGSGTGGVADPSTAEATLPPLSSIDAPQLNQAWTSLRSSGSALANESAAVAARWKTFTANLRKIYPEAPEATDSVSANAALQQASSWLAERSKAANQSRSAGTDQARDAVLSEIAALRTDLESLRRYRDSPLSAKLKSLLILGGNRSAPKGIDLVWIPDRSKGSAGGFWAAKRETSLAQYKDVAGREPASAFRKPTGGSGGGGASDADIDRQIQEARTKFLANAPAANRESAALAFDDRMAPKLRAQYKAAAEQRAQQAASGYEKFPADLANMTEKDDSQPFLSKLQQSDLPGSAWQYRLPTREEWALLQGKVDGIGTPDLSEWLADSSAAVDRNWKAEQATSPPAPGTVGFRVVLAGQSP